MSKASLTITVEFDNVPDTTGDIREAIELLTEMDGAKVQEAQLKIHPPHMIDFLVEGH